LSHRYYPDYAGFIEIEMLNIPALASMGADLRFVERVQREMTHPVPNEGPKQPFLLWFFVPVTFIFRKSKS